MRYSLMLPFAAIMVTATPAMAQDATTPQQAMPTPTPPGDPVKPVDPVTPPSTDPLPTAPETATPATPAPPAAKASASLSAEQQAAYDAWPVATKTYFDALTPVRQALFLRIADADKAKLVVLPASQQEGVWTALEKQDAEQKAKTPMGT